MSHMKAMPVDPWTNDLSVYTAVWIRYADSSSAKFQRYMRAGLTPLACLKCRRLQARHRIFQGGFKSLMGMICSNCIPSCCRQICLAAWGKLRNLFGITCYRIQSSIHINAMHLYTAYLIPS
jgi:hypothetical protein